jgi:hypothetical protein
MGAYVTAAEIKERLLGKVKFTNDDLDENAVSSGTPDPGRWPAWDRGSSTTCCTYGSVAS